VKDLKVGGEFVERGWLVPSNRVQVLDYKPNDDQNVYLLCNYEIGNSRAEVGLSLNNFTAMTITYGHRLSFNELTK